MSVEAIQRGTRAMVENQTGWALMEHDGIKWNCIGVVELGSAAEEWIDRVKEH